VGEGGPFECSLLDQKLRSISSTDLANPLHGDELEDLGPLRDVGMAEGGSRIATTLGSLQEGGGSGRDKKERDLR
jgi:hypothetical protein